MLELFLEQQQLAEVLFGLSLLLGPLLTSLYEIAISTRAIKAELADIDAKCRHPKG